jgi:hypothetical protein
MKTKIDFMQFLADHGVDVKPSGKNIYASGGYFGTCCPDCGDSNYHLNIKLDGSKARCFHGCNYEGMDAYALAKKLTDISSFKELKEIFTEYPYTGETFEGAKEIVDIDDQTVRFNELWGSFKKLGDEAGLTLFNKYLKGRGFHHPEKLVDIRVTKKGDYAWRVLMGVKDLSGQVVFFIGRHIGDSSQRYLNCPIEDAIKDPSQLVALLHESLLRTRLCVKESKSSAFKSGNRLNT